MCRPCGWVVSRGWWLPVSPATNGPPAPFATRSPRRSSPGSPCRPLNDALPGAQGGRAAARRQRPGRRSGPSRPSTSSLRQGFRSYIGAPIRLGGRQRLRDALHLRPRRRSVSATSPPWRSMFGLFAELVANQSRCCGPHLLREQFVAVLEQRGDGAIAGAQRPARPVDERAHRANPGRLAIVAEEDRDTVSSAPNSRSLPRRSPRSTALPGGRSPSPP